ncbi:MAG: beta-glucosidase [Ilumatobacter sp.]|uniref:beta-glucosidase family protein n=1 Tax=Ilumatobacter sp. TaxID=1967498 RepID=UPI00391D8814
MSDTIPDPRHAADDDLRHVVASLPLPRRIELLSGSGFWATTAIEEADIPSIVLTDGPHGVRRQPDDSDHLGIGNSIPATCFPTASLLGATWDRDLLHEVGAALGREARSLGVGVLLGPGLNIKRHPAGGRNFEYLSEDPVVSGHLAAAIVRGTQSEGVGACLKHFVANNHESYRMVVDVIVDERTLRELYLRGFEIAVREGRPWVVMTSYNQVNGQYVSDSRHLLHDVLRSTWDFDGAVVTDWGGIHDRVAAVRAGTDLEMPSSGGAYDALVRRAVESGELGDDEVTERALAVARLARRSRAAHERLGPVEIDHLEQHRLSRRVAAAGTVLLTNDGTLPLRSDADIAVIGAFAARPRLQGAGSSSVVPTREDAPLRALEERMTGRVRYSDAYDPDTGRSDPSRLRAAAELAATVDVAVVIVGLPAIDEAEGYDRTSLSLPAAHDELVAAVCAANPRTVVVVQSGAPVFMPWVERAGAVVFAYLAGQAAGSALVDVLLGEAEPGGRLAETMPASMAIPANENFHGRGRQVQYREGLYVGYRYYDTAGIAPRFAFGHGLSYTTFEWSDPQVTGSGTDLDVSVTVTNTGLRPGSDVVQLYVAGPKSSLDRPDKELREFAKVSLDPGASSTVRLHLDERAFAHFDRRSEAWVVEPGPRTLHLAASALDVRHRLDVTVGSVEVSHADLEPTPRPARRRTRFLSTATEFEAMLGRPIPAPTPALPFTLDTVVEELDTTRLGRVARRGFERIAAQQSAKLLGDDPDPVLVKLSQQMLREAPLRFLVSMSAHQGARSAFEALTALLSTLRLTGRR